MKHAKDDSLRWHLKPLHIPELTALVPIEGEGIRVGRDPTNEMIVPGTRFPHVSAFHARVALENGRPVVMDLESKNGTFVNGKRITRHELDRGDTIQLGELGPRFTVLSGEGTEETVTFDLTSMRGRSPTDSQSMSQTAILKLRRALGIPEERAVGEILVSRGRRQTLITVILVLVLVAVGILAFSELRREGRESVARLEKRNEALQAEINRRMDLADCEIDARALLYEENKHTLEKTRDELRERLTRLEHDEAASVEQIEKLRSSLREASDTLARYDPVTLEAARLASVRKVRQAVVYIEAKVTLRDEITGAQLYVRNEGGGYIPNLDGEGALFSTESSGSGFCVSSEGHILTNGHVIVPESAKEPWIGPDGTQLIPEVSFDVIFSGESKRHPAEKIQVAFDGTDDVALIKIEPFEGMPVIDAFRTDVLLPEENTEVYLVGFPLGKNVIQQGDVVIASTFKGILSRIVTPYYQVDAGVHPGNSGGPLIDVAGHVIGIVTAVQGSPEGSVAHIGYVIPIASAKAVWPPKAPSAGS